MTPDAKENLFDILHYVVDAEVAHYEETLAQYGDEQHPAVLGHIYSKVLRAIYDLTEEE